MILQCDKLIMRKKDSLMDKMQIDNDPVLAEILKRLINFFQPERIYLFGSKARGDEGPNSDYDLMVIMPDDASPERRRNREIYEHLWSTGAAADIVVWTNSLFERRKHLAASLPATVLREGRLLYAS